MKSSLFFTGGLALAMMAASCNNGAETDSTKMADSANDAKIDSAKTADTSARPSAMADMKPDAEFAVAAADGGMMEVQLGKMAQEKGIGKAIKSLGAMMVKDHGAANTELMAAAKAKDIILPAALSEKCQKKVQDLSEKTGVDFDKAYADLMVSDHKDDIDAFKKEADKGNDPQLSAWAKSKIPTLEHHLMMAEEAKKAANKK